MKTILLTRGRVALVDDDDFERLSKYRWHYLGGGAGYARRCIREGVKKKSISMHREIMNPASGMEIDHIDGDGLHNCRSNLREVTHVQNMMNQRNRAAGTSPYKGVYFSKKRQKFVSQIQFSCKRIYLGEFTDERLAAQAYNDAAVKYFGPFACLNVL